LGKFELEMRLTNTDNNKKVKLNKNQFVQGIFIENCLHLFN